MKILIDARMYGLEHSGIGRYIINLTEELKNIKSSDRYVILLRKKYYNELKFSENWKKILVDVSHYTFREQLELPFILYKEKPDLVHFPHFNIPIFWNGNFVVTIHDMTMHKQGVDATTQIFPLYIFKRLPYKFVFNTAVNKSKMIITPSDAVKKEVVDYYKVSTEKVRVIYEGFEEIFFQEKMHTGGMELLTKFGLSIFNYFIYVGNAYPHKNLSVVIKAIKKLNEGNGLNCFFAIAGSRNRFVERTEKLILKECAQKYVKILGYVTDYELKMLYRNSLAFIYPSLSEGFGLQGLEAMAAGTLIAASDIPVFREIYKDNAQYFDPNDDNSVINIMNNIVKMKNDERLIKIDKAKEYIKIYSWRKMAEETLGVYKKCR